jgi:hypothetical protein
MVRVNKQLRAFQDKEIPMTRFQITISGFKRGSESSLVVLSKITSADIVK